MGRSRVSGLAETRRGIERDANDHEEAIELVRSGKVSLGPFVTRRILVDDIVAQGIERLMTHKDGEVKILLSMR